MSDRDQDQLNSENSPEEALKAVHQSSPFPLTPNLEYNKLLSMESPEMEYHNLPTLYANKNSAPKFMQDIEGHRTTTSTSPNTILPTRSFPRVSVSQKPGFENKSARDEEDTNTPSQQNVNMNKPSASKYFSAGHQFIKISTLEKEESKQELENVTFNLGDMALKRTPSMQTSTNKDDDKNKLKKKPSLGGKIASFFQLRRSQTVSEVAKKSRGPRLSLKQFELINDKTFLSGEMLNQLRPKKKTNDRKKQLPRFKQLLQKHHIVRPDVQADFVKRIIAKVRHNRGGIFYRIKGTVKRYYKKAKDGIESLKEMLSNFARSIRPHGKFKYCMNTICTCFFVYELLYVPFQIGFEVDPIDGHLVFETVKDVFFLVDILFMFHTAFVSEGNYITSHRKIAVNYIKKWFVFDLLASLPYAIIFNAIDTAGTGLTLMQIRFRRLVLILRFLRIVRLKNVFGRLKDDMHSQVMTGVLSLLKLLGSIIFLAHIVACVWHLVGLVVLEETSISWISEFGFAHQGISERYVASFYWTILTMMTVGYGDITPVTMVERILNIFVMLLGCGVFGYSMNSIGILLQNINAGVSKKRQKYYIINKFMSRKHLSKETQSRVQQYLDYLFETQNEGKAEEDAILAMLSDGIQERIRKEINGRVLKENLLFQTIFGTKFLSLLSHYLEEKIFSPGELIYHERDKQNCIFFVSSGSVELYHGETFHKVYSVQKGSYFGELAFFTGKPREFGARSDSFSSLFFLKQQTFLEIVEDYPPEKETFHVIKDKINLYNNYQALKLSCYSCGKDDHRIGTCPALHYVPNHEKIIYDYNKEMEEFNLSFMRRPRTRYSARAQMHFTNYKARTFKPQYDDNQTPENRRESFSLASLNRLGNSRENFIIEKPKLREGEPQRKVIPRHKTAKMTGEKSLSELEIFSGELDYVQPTASINRVPNYLTLNEEDTCVFETVMNFQIYFPHNNLAKIIETINQKRQKMTKKKEIQDQIEGLKVGVEKLSLPFGKQYTRKMSLVPSTPFSGLRARSRYWAFLFGDETFSRSRSLKKKSPTPNNFSEACSPDKSSRGKNVKFYDSFKKQLAAGLKQISRSASAKRSRSYLEED